MTKSSPPPPVSVSNLASLCDLAFEFEGGGAGYSQHMMMSTEMNLLNSLISSLQSSPSYFPVFLTLVDRAMEGRDLPALDVILRFAPDSHVVRLWETGEAETEPVAYRLVEKLLGTYDDNKSLVLVDDNNGISLSSPKVLRASIRKIVYAVLSVLFSVGGRMEEDILIELSMSVMSILVDAGGELVGDIELDGACGNLVEDAGNLGDGYIVEMVRGCVEGVGGKKKSGKKKLSSEAKVFKPAPAPAPSSPSPSPSPRSMDSTLNKPPSPPATAARQQQHQQYSSSVSQNLKIDQVLAVFPSLGLGFIEAGLACYSNSPELFLDALLSSSLHPRLANLDRALPARKRGAEKTYKPETMAEEEKDRARREMVERERKEENDAFLASKAEYDDDYDDQYDDGMGGVVKVGGGREAASGYDFDAIRAYNSAKQSDEVEATFWEETRNDNRSLGKGKRQDFGPDKIRGGRELGPDGKVVRKGGARGKKTIVNSDGKAKESTKKSREMDKNNEAKGGEVSIRCRLISPRGAGLSG